jgi:single-strand DNA-binding protein
MASFNKVILMGNLTRDPEVRYTTGGSAVCDITLAVNYQWTDKRSNERKEEVSFIDVTLWGRTAEIAGEYLAKGRPVLIEGRLQQDKWDDKETGQKRSKLKVVADAMQLLGGRSEGGAPGAGGGNPPAKSAAARPAASSPRGNDSYADADSGRTPDQSFYDDMPSSGGDDVPF